MNGCSWGRKWRLALHQESKYKKRNTQYGVHHYCKPSSGVCVRFGGRGQRRVSKSASPQPIIFFGPRWMLVSGLVLRWYESTVGLDLRLQ